MPITYRDATQADLGLMLHDLREVDVEEWRKASGKTPAEHLAYGTWSVPEKTTGVLTRVAVDDLGPVLLYGVEKGAVEGYGWVWLIACNRAEKHVIEFHKSWDDEIAILGEAYRGQLYTASWIANRKHHKWLRWVGFRQAGFPVKFGPFNALFQPFIYGA